MRKHHLSLAEFLLPVLAGGLVWGLVLNERGHMDGLGFCVGFFVFIWPLLAMLVWSLPSILVGLVTTPRQRAARRKRRKDKGYARSAPIRSWVRRAVFRADRYRCVYCHKYFRRGKGLEADHYWPYAGGGLSNAFNVLSLCKFHNDVKSNYWMDPDGYEHYRPYGYANIEMAREILAAERWRRRNPLRWVRCAWALAW